MGITAGSREVPGRNACDRRHAYCIIIIIRRRRRRRRRSCNWVVTRWQWLFYMHTKYEAGY